MPRKSKPKMTTPPTIYTIPFNEPVSQPLHIPPPPPLSEPEEERQYWLRKNMALDGYSEAAIDTAIANLNAPMAPDTIDPSLEKGKALAPGSPVIEYSLAELAGEQKLIQPLPAPQPIQPAAAPETIYPKITRHKGQRVQTCKNIFTSVTIQHRKALDLLRERTRKSMKEVLCEAIADCAVKHGLATQPGDIWNWPDWD
ncbi:MAG: hypothetical protein WCI03_15050 [bacterium]